MLCILQGGPSDYGTAEDSAAHGAKLMSTAQRLEQSSERLEQSRRMLVETEEIGRAHV